MHTVLEAIRLDLERDLKSDRLDVVLLKAITGSRRRGNRLANDALAGYQRVNVVALGDQLSILGSSSYHERSRSHKFAPFAQPSIVGGLIRCVLVTVRWLD